MEPLKTQAIQTALTGDWQTAISLNLALLKENPNDIETLNRLAFASLVVGKIKNAKDAYKKVLELDSKNPIALKNLKRLTEKNKKIVNSTSFSQSLLGEADIMFIEEGGKTKVIELVNVAEPKIINHLMTGESLNIRIKRLKIFVLDIKLQYIGMLPDNLAKRLIRFLKGGNSYVAYVKAVENHRVTIFIKEIKRAARFKNEPSFTPGGKSSFKIAKSPLKKYSQGEDQEDSESTIDNERA